MTLVRTDSSQVLTWTPQMTDPRWLGHIGHVSALKYDWVMPGGCDQLTATLAVEPNIRTPAMNPGRIVQVYRGAGLIWEGIMQEPVPGTDGWAIAAVGAGNYGTNFAAYYTSTWPSGLPDQAVNDAISRGLRWSNPGLDGTSGLWFGSEVDPAAQTITDLLNLVCTYGALTWIVTTTGYGGNVISIIPIPVTPTNLLVVSTPQGRTLGGDINTVFEKYVVTADNSTTGAAEVDGVTSSENAGSVALYGPMETYIDLTQAGPMSAGTAQGYGTNVLAKFVHASWAAPITAGPYQLLTLGGQPCDLGVPPCWPMVAQLLLVDYGYGGEVNLAQPTSFPVGAYAYDDDAQTAAVTPFQALDLSLASLLSSAGTTLPQASTTS